MFFSLLFVPPCLCGLPPMNVTYKNSGVDQVRKDKLIDRILRLSQKTFGPEVLPNPWGFAGLFSLNKSLTLGKRLRDPVLIGCADGVGTKVKVACAAGRHKGIGVDLVAMSVNDLIVTGGSPLFFLDYVATSKVDEAVIGDVVEGVVDGCRQSECALLGGETAEMPGTYSDGEYDLAGFAVGIVERARILDGKSVRPGDAVIGLHSSGLHSNGYSMVRRALLDSGLYKLDQHLDDLGATLADELLKPTLIYVKTVKQLLRHYRVKKAVKAISHITGGGLIENIPRVMPATVDVEIRRGSWTEPPIFSILQRAAHVDDAEMFRVFNMGIGLVLIVGAPYESAVLRRLRRAGAARIGQVVKGSGTVKIV